MTFDLEIGEQEKFHINFDRDWFWGTLEIRVNGKLVESESPLNPLTHISNKLTTEYSFVLDDAKRSDVIIRKIRPLLLAGFRPQKYIVLVRGNQIAEYKGY